MSQYRNKQTINWMLDQFKTQSKAIPADFQKQTQDFREGKFTEKAIWDAFNKHFPKLSKSDWMKDYQNKKVEKKQKRASRVSVSAPAQNPKKEKKDAEKKDAA